MQLCLANTMRAVSAILSICACAGLVSSLCTQRAIARTFHVSPHGGNQYPYNTYEKAANRLRTLDTLAIQDGDVVMIHAGEYSAPSTFEVSVGVNWIGDGADSVMLRWSGGQPSTPILRALGRNVLSGICFVNPEPSRDQYLTAIYLGDNGPHSTAVQQCRFVACRISKGIMGPVLISENEFEVWLGIGVWVHGSGYTRIDGNSFVSGPNADGRGIGVRAGSGEVVIENNVFDFRPAADHGTPIEVDAFTQSTVQNNRIFAGERAIFWTYANGSIENNLIMGPRSPVAGIEATLTEFNAITIRNNFFGDFASLPLFYNECVGCPHTGTISYRFNAFWPPVDSFFSMLPDARLTITETANFNAFPMFDYGVLRDLYRLQAGSPLIDGGDSVVLDVDGTRSDVGCNGGPGGTSYTYRDLPPLPPETLTVAREDTTPMVRWSARAEADLEGYRLFRGYESGFWHAELSPISEFDVSITTARDALPHGTEAVYYVVTSFDRSGRESEPSPEAGYDFGRINRPPSWLSIPRREIHAGDSLRLRVVALDPDSDPLVLMAGPLPANAQFTDSTNGVGHLEFQPDSTQAGEYTIDLVASDGEFETATSAVISVTDQAETSPSSGIITVYPNPMSGQAMVKLYVPSASEAGRHIVLVLHDLLGRTVATCFDGSLSEGVQDVEIDLTKGSIGTDLANGVYFLRMQTGTQTVGELAKIAVSR